MTRDELFVDHARKYLGVPWRHQGRSRGGLDCVGLVVLAARDCGLDAPLAATYGRLAHYFILKPILCEFAYRIPEPRMGALLLFKNKTILHMGIATEKKKVIQALNTVGKVIESSINFKICQVWAIKWPC